jgi:hypothetical protein
MYTRATSLPNLYIRNIIPDDMNIPLLEYRALSGWGEAVFLYLRERRRSRKFVKKVSKNTAFE